MKRDNRRSFLKKITTSGLGAFTMSGTFFSSNEKLSDKNNTSELNAERDLQGKHRYNQYYSGEFLDRIAFPIGGIGAGMFCIEGNGAFSHFSVEHHPDIFNEPNIFAALHIKDSKFGAKVLQGPVPGWKKFGLPNSGNGDIGTNYGLPRFEQAKFKARLPFCYIQLSDKDVPFEIEVIGWSPFIPTSEDESSLPVGAIEYTFHNNSNSSREAVFSFNTENFMQRHPDPRNFMKAPNHLGSIKKIKNGMILSRTPSTDEPWRAGDFAIFINDDATVGDYCWFRGGWWDPLTMAWENIKKGEIKKREPVDMDAPGASLFVPFKLNSGEKKVIRVMTAWYVPESNLLIGEDATSEELQAKAACSTSSGCCVSPNESGISDYGRQGYNKYRPWYCSKFNNVRDVMGYWEKNYSSLVKKSLLFKEAYFSSTLPPEVIEAVASNLTILKSPTVLRQYDGRLWAFEGCMDNSGCCYGSCTHVWNYAQAIPHLFPSLERSLRETEFCESQSSDGHQMFRANLPIRPVHNSFVAAADGQLGGIMKIYREWRISGNTEWMRKLFPMVKKSINYCIKTWDPRHLGIIQEPHQNTYDIDFWGPDGMCTSFYLGALNAIIKMGKYLNEDILFYQKLYKTGKKYLENDLFNGEYFFQKIEYKNLNAFNPAKETEQKSYEGKYSPEALDLLKKEGPKYQYGTGCLSDGILGAWIGRMCAIEDFIDSGKITSHLLSVYKYNLKKDLSEHANPQRPSYALGNEGGLLLCTWPKGGKLSLPFVYSDEVWTGIEYQVASHLMLMGKVKEGLDIVRLCRDRYDGRVRNPFNEYECGHWYARAMSSYGMLEGLTGVRYDAVEKTLYIDSKIGDFTSFLSTATGFGNVSLKSGKAKLDTVYGKIDVNKIIVSGKEMKA